MRNFPRAYLYLYIVSPHTFTNVKVRLCLRSQNRVFPVWIFQWICRFNKRNSYNIFHSSTKGYHKILSNQRVACHSPWEKLFLPQQKISGTFYPMLVSQNQVNSMKITNGKNSKSTIPSFEMTTIRCSDVQLFKTWACEQQCAYSIIETGTINTGNSWKEWDRCMLNVYHIWLVMKPTKKETNETGSCCMRNGDTIMITKTIHYTCV